MSVRSVAGGGWNIQTGMPFLKVVVSGSQDVITLKSRHLNRVPE